MQPGRGHLADQSAPRSAPVDDTPAQVEDLSVAARRHIQARLRGTAPRSAIKNRGDLAIEITLPQRHQVQRDMSRALDDTLGHLGFRANIHDVHFALLAQDIQALRIDLADSVHE